MRLYNLSGGNICNCQGGRLYGMAPISKNNNNGKTQPVSQEIKKPINEPIPNIEQLQSKLSRLSTTKLKGKNRFISL